MVDDLSLEFQGWGQLASVNAELVGKDGKALHSLCVGDGLGVGLVDALLDDCVELGASYGLLH